MNNCDALFLGICLTRPPVEHGNTIFGFSEFLAALALLVLVFNSSDFLYKFRNHIAPIPLKMISFYSIIFIGVGTLVTDIWFEERWYSLPWGFSKSILQTMFGFLFLFIISLWIWFAFFRPPIFSRFNAERYYNALFRTIIRGSDTELPVLAEEIWRSAESLISASAQHKNGEVSIPASKPATYA